MSVVSYDVEVLNNTKEIRNIIANTMNLYNSALNYVCDVVYDNKDELPQDVLFLEKEFGGSFIGLFKSFKFFTCDKNYNQINENLK